MELAITDALDTLSATPKALAQLVAEADAAALDAVPAEGEWSARTLLAHLRDDEFLCQRVAVERMLAEDSPEVVFIDGSDWEPRRNRTRDRKDLLLVDFALQRQASLGILRGLRDEDWERRGRTGGREFTIAEFVAGWAGHDREHLAQLERALGETLEQVLERRAHPGV